MPSPPMTQERAAQRFHHLQRLGRLLDQVNGDIATCKEHLKELRDRQEGLIDRIRCAARDEGELPLFDLDDGQ